MPLDLADTKHWLMRRASRVHNLLWLTRAKTLGVRAIALDAGRVLLVRHTYRQGWYLPGGGVDRDETAEAAAIRELREEAGIVCNGRPVLHGFYRNRAHSPRDHVACYVVRDFTAGPRAPDWEIAETGFFPVDALPDGTTRATRARLGELFEDRPISADW